MNKTGDKLRNLQMEFIARPGYSDSFEVRLIRPRTSVFKSNSNNR
jgi:hypothetical protein